MATAVFAVGIAIVLACSARTSASLRALGDVQYPYLDATTQFASQLDTLVGTIQSAVAEGDKKRLEEADERAASMRKSLQAMQAIPSRGEAATKLRQRFDEYYAAATDTAQVILAIKAGDAAAAAKRMQGSQQALESELKGMREGARQAFDAGLSGAEGGVTRSLYATLASAVAVVLGLGLGSHLLIGGVWRQLGGEPEYARRVMRRIAEGDLSERVVVHSGAEHSLLAAVRDMTQGLSGIVGEVRGGSSRMRDAAREIAVGNQDLSERTEQQAASLERTSARMHQLTETVQQNASSAQEASRLASTASDVASRGGDAVSQVVSTMAEISASSRRISDIIGVIDGIAFQTNILALNAAVEAARAGEQGRGFAVVAGEVRNLAQRSAAAAKEVKTLIGTSVERVESGTRHVQSAGATMSEIVQSVAQVADIIDKITHAAADQSAGIRDVNDDVRQLDDMTQRNAALVEEAAAAASSLQQQSEGLEAAVATFRLQGVDGAAA